MGNKDELYAMRQQLEKLKEKENNKKDIIIIPDDAQSEINQELKEELEKQKQIIKNPQSGFTEFFGLISLSTALIISIIAFIILS